MPHPFHYSRFNTRTVVLVNLKPFPKNFFSSKHPDHSGPFPAPLPPANRFITPTLIMLRLTCRTVTIAMPSYGAKLKAGRILPGHALYLCNSLFCHWTLRSIYLLLTYTSLQEVQPAYSVLWSLTLWWYPLLRSCGLASPSRLHGVITVWIVAAVHVRCQQCSRVLELCGCLVSTCFSPCTV